VIELFSPADGLLVKTDSATFYGDVDMAVEIDTVRTLKKIGKVRRKVARSILQIIPARVYGIE